MNSPETVVLYGASSSIIVDLEETCIRAGIEVVAIVKNHPAPSQAIQSGKVVDLGDLPASMLANPVAVSLFTPGNRKSAYAEAWLHGARDFCQLIDPTAILPDSLEIDEGVYINCGAVIGGMSKLARFVFINRAATLGHHVEVAPFASVGPGVATGAHVSIGLGAVLGTAAIILPGVSIGANAVVGAGAVVTRNVPNNAIVVGNPARVIRDGVVGYNGVGVDE
jgi:serine acetyltransferase